MAAPQRQDHASKKLSVIHGPAGPALLRTTFNDVLRTQSACLPNNAAVISFQQGKTLTYGQLDERSTYLAAALRSLGVKRGERVAVLLGNRVEYVEIFMACSKLGAYFTLFNYAYTLSELLDAVKATSPRILLTTLKTSRYDYGGALEVLSNSSTSLQNIILLDDLSGCSSRSHNPSVLNYTELLATRKSDFDPVHVHDTDIFTLLFTSGSTGLPKAAALTHHNMVNSAEYIALQMSVKDADRIVVPVPLFHAFGLIIGLCVALVRGAAIVLPSEYFDAEATLQSVAAYQCTGLYGVTTMFVDMLSHPSFQETKRSSLRFGLMAGSAMPDGLLKRVISSFPIPDLYTNWGMTELSSIASMTTAADSVEKKLKTAGRLLPNFSCMIVDPVTAAVLPWGKRGEIIVSGFGVMHSYYGDPERTAQVVRSHPQYDPKDHPPLRWMHTGDEGCLDRQGYLIITGRLKDLIIRGGENISPLEIEARLYQHASIKQAAVFGVPSARYGEEVAAMLELQETARERPTDTELKAWVRTALSRYKVPVWIWWLGDSEHGVPSEWPKTSNGKLKKMAIRELGAALLRSGYSPEPPSAPSL